MTATKEILDTAGTAEHDTRTRLLKAAARLVHAQSYHSVGVKAICDEAAVRRGSFYHFFESKQSLMLEALDLAWQRFVREGLAACRDESLTPRQRIESLVEFAADTQRRYQQRTGRVLGCTFGNLAAEAATLDDEIRRRLEEIFSDWAAIVAEPLAEAERRGEIDPCFDPLTAAGDVVAGLQGLILLAKVANDPEVVATGGHVIVERVFGCSHQGDG